MGKGEGKGDGKGDGKGGGCCCNNSVEDLPEAPNPTDMDRSCTDTLFLLAFIAFWLGMFVCASMGFAKGDPSTLLYFVDYNGNSCGKGDLSDYKYTYWTHPMNSGTNVCVKACPKQYELFTLTANSSYVGTSNIGYTRVVADSTKCGAEGSVGCADSVNSPSTLANSGTSFPSGKAGCCAWFDAPAPTGLYFCVPAALKDAGTSYAKEYLETGAAKFQTATKDLVVGWWILVVGAVLALIVSFIWLQLLKRCAGCFVWSAIILSNIAALLLTGASFYAYTVYKDAYDKNGLDSDQQTMYLAIACCAIFGVLFILLFCATVCLCKQIRIAVGIIQETCDAVNTMPFIVLFPLIQYLFMIIFFCFWVVGTMYMVSSGEKRKDPTTGVWTMYYEDDMKKAMVYWFFGLLWNMAFMRHMTILIIAGCFGSYYWTPLQDKKEGNYPFGSTPVASSVKRSIRYHMGTVAFGSFIIAVIQFIRAVLAYIKEKYLKDKPALKCLVTYIECCMACFERLMEFISKNAYIVTACKGNMFCTAACQAFKFIFNNLAQVSVVTWVSMYIMVLGKGFIVAGTLAISFFICGANSDLSSPWLILVVVGLLSFLVASLFLGVFEAGIDTILVCFCWERDQKGAYKPREDGKVHAYASENLMKFIEGAALAMQNAEKAADASAPGGVQAVQPAGESAASGDETPGKTA
jgi:choline transporter-like protein 2/4/5